MPVNECEEFCCMFTTTLNGQKILYGAEMDGVESDHFCDLNNADFNQLKCVELKVKLREQNHRQKENYFRFKLRNWWCQSFLVNIKKIIVGTRTADGIVNELSTIDVKDIPKQCQVCEYLTLPIIIIISNKFSRIFSNTGCHLYAWHSVVSFYNISQMKCKEWIALTMYFVLNMIRQSRDTFS